MGRWEGCCRFESAINISKFLKRSRIVSHMLVIYRYLPLHLWFHITFVDFVVLLIMLTQLRSINIVHNSATSDILTDDSWLRYCVLNNLHTIHYVPHYVPLLYHCWTLSVSYLTIVWQELCITYFVVYCLVFCRIHLSAFLSLKLLTF